MKKVILLFASIFLVFVNSIFAQFSKITISGQLKSQASGKGISYANILLKNSKDSSFVTGTISQEDGRFLLSNIKPGNYLLEFSFIGYLTKKQTLYVGSLTEFLDIQSVFLEENKKLLNEVVVNSKPEEMSEKMDKKTFEVQNNISQSGGSVLQVMQNLPGVTVQDGKVMLRGNDKVVVLMDGKQTGLTGFGSQSGLDNIPASAIEKIEIINNPSAKYDANGNAGIINIIYKSNKKDGFNGKVGLSGGLGALWRKHENLPDIRPQYQFTPKINPTISLNYRKNKLNLFLQADYLYTQTLNKNEFVTRIYDDGTVINQQTKRNRNTGFFTGKAGMDWNINERNSFTVSGLFGSEKIIDRGDEPFFNADLSQRYRLWQFLEDELKTTAMGTASFRHKFKQAGHLLNIGFNYTYHRENEKYFFDNILPAYTGKDAFKLISDEHVADFNFDYVRPLKYGRIEGGFKFRERIIPTNMLFVPGLNSPLDTNSGGWATYKETIPAIYGNYVFENKKYEAELGLRVEYVGLRYEVNPNHNTYKSNGYHYTQPFPNLRLAYKINEQNKISLFYNRRVDRPNEVDIRIFPKYDDAEIIKVGNPALRPQFTNSLEFGFKNSHKTGTFYAAIYGKMANGTITRISSTVPGSNIIYAIFQNVNHSYNSGIEIVLSEDPTKWFSFNLNVNAYYNQIDSFSVQNLYPVSNVVSSPTQKIISGTAKINCQFHLPKHFEAQLSAIYLAPDLIPQGKIQSRFSLDLGIKKIIQKGKGEIFLNATDLLNTMNIRKTVNGVGFRYISNDYYETQVIRIGYNYKF